MIRVFALPLIAAIGFFVLSACDSSADDATTAAATSAQSDTMQAEAPHAIFAGGCFWCVEADFEKLAGVTEVVSGYSGGTTQNPTYRNYSDGGHREVAKIYYNPAKIDYRTLADYFFRTVDPLDDGGQFCDRGFDYTTAIYVLNEDQQAAAEAAKQAAEAELGEEVVTPILDAEPFYDAEDYHQDFYKKSSLRYNTYRRGCGRDARLNRLWGGDRLDGFEKKDK